MLPTSPVVDFIPEKLSMFAHILVNSVNVQNLIFDLILIKDKCYIDQLVVNIL